MDDSHVGTCGTYENRIPATDRVMAYEVGPVQKNLRFVSPSFPKIRGCIRPDYTSSKASICLESTGSVHWPNAGGQRMDGGTKREQGVLQL